MARDFPGLHEEVKAGRLSVHKASVTAGFVKPRKPVIQIPADWEWIERARAEAERRGLTLAEFIQQAVDRSIERGE